MIWSTILKTAIRDSRKDRSKLALFMSSIILGVAALVAINSFNDNLVEDINNQSKSLLGADISVTSNKPFAEEIQLQLDSLDAKASREQKLFSMGYIPKIDEAQFVQIKAIEGGFPYYGEIVTEPKSAYRELGQGDGALLDDGFMLQYGLEVGDSLKLGDHTFPISGRLVTSMGSMSMGSSFAPPVYIKLADLEKTNLVQPGSFVEYANYYMTDPSFDADEWEDNIRKKLRDNSTRVTTVDDQRRQLNRAFSSLNEFLNLVALISLILACIGVASSVLIYVKSKIQNIAVLRCLGMKRKEAFMVYFVQIFFLGLLSVIIGVALGSVIQLVLPMVLKEFLPFDVSMSLSPSAMISGFLMGLVVTLLFALGPLLSIRNITPLNTLRVSDTSSQGRDMAIWMVYVAIFLTIFGYLWWLNGSVLESVFTVVGLLVAFLVLYGVAQLVTWGVRKYFPSRASYVVRQGLSNLYRPNNQTRTLIVSMGLGTAILTMLFIIQGLILNNVADMGAGNQPNMILYGIEQNQKDEIETITESFDMPVLQNVPVVTMDLVGWQGKTKKEWMQDTTRRARRWAANREARVSYQTEMDPSDKLLRGTFTGVHDGGDSIMISLGVDYADGLGVDIGDELVWNVQGAQIKTYVGSIRELEFRRLESRFFILFPTGVLEKAPQFRILVTKSPDKKITAQYRNAVVKAMPNVSVVDLGSILVTLNDILSKVSYVIKFMAGFSILTGLIVLISSLFLSKFQRIRETVLLRTIGASRKKILWINAVEYLALGVLATLTGIVISIGGSYLLAKYVFELDFVLDWTPIVLVFLGIVLLTVLIGLWNNREVVNSSPLEVLRRV